MEEEGGEENTAHGRQCKSKAQHANAAKQKIINENTCKMLFYSFYAPI